MKMCLMLGRALALHRALYPHIDEQEKRRRRRASQGTDPRAGTGLHPYLKGAAISYTALIAQRCQAGTSHRTDVTCEDVAASCQSSLEEHFEVHPEDPTWQAIHAACAGNSLKILDFLTAHVFKRCQMDHFLASSKLACTSIARIGHSEASSYCLVSVVGEDGQDCRMPAVVLYFFMLQWHQSNGVERWAKVCVLSYCTDENECSAFGQTVYRIDVSVETKKENELVLPVSDIARPVILIKPGPRRVMCRLVQFQGRLLGSYAREGREEGG